jgi:hypothetical protein
MVRKKDLAKSKQNSFCLACFCLTQNIQKQRNQTIIRESQNKKVVFLLLGFCYFYLLLINCFFFWFRRFFVWYPQIFSWAKWEIQTKIREILIKIRENQTKNKNYYFYQIREIQKKKKAKNWRNPNKKSVFLLFGFRRFCLDFTGFDFFGSTIQTKTVFVLISRILFLCVLYIVGFILGFAFVQKKNEELETKHYFFWKLY